MVNEFSLSYEITQDMLLEEQFGVRGVKANLGTIVGDIKSRMQEGQKIILMQERVDRGLGNGLAQRKREEYYALRKTLISAFDDNGTIYYVKVNEDREGNIHIEVEKNRERAKVALVATGAYA